MNQIKRGLRRIKANPWSVFTFLNDFGLLRFLRDETVLKLHYRGRFNGRRLRLEDPQTLNEKLQWLKLHDRKPEYIRMVDKYEAKRYIAERIGEQYTIPTLGLWERFDDIDFEKLPDQFVLKCTHDSGGLVIVKDKSKLDKEATRRKIEKSLRRNYFWSGREWPYKDVLPRIIAEEYMVDESGTELKDYKVFCFNGVPTYVEVDFNRFVEHKLNPYDFDWKPLHFCDSSPNDYDADIEKPERLEDMRQIAAQLSQGIRFLRVDFYSIYDRLLVGELTLYPGSGFIQFNPPSVDEELGCLLKLEENKE